MPSNRHRLLTLGIAGVVGVTAAIWIWPRWRTHRALQMITADAAPRRANAWAWLEADDGSGRLRLESHRPTIESRLAAATPAALLDGAIALRRARRWGWRETERGLVERELALRAASRDPADHTLALDALSTAPLDLTPAAILEPASNMMRIGDPPVRTAALDHALAWAGRDRVGLLSSLRAAAPARMDLAQSWGRPPAPGIDLRVDADPRRRAAALVRAAAARPDDATPLLAAADDASTREIGPYLLHLSRDPRAHAMLERLASGNRTAARFALLALDPTRDAERSARMAGNPAADLTSRRIAAWRWPAVPVATVREILARDPADEDGHVATAALLAERRLPAHDAGGQAEQWIRSFDDAEKRAGALLAALLGTHRDLLARAHALEDQPDVRTIQRLALWALGTPTGPDDPVEFAHRVVHRPDGEFDPDVALCMLRAGRHETLTLLTSRPLPRRTPVQNRAWLIERFVPGWHAEAGRPIGGSPEGVRLHFDRLDALRVLTQRRMEFDENRAHFREADTDTRE